MKAPPLLIAFGLLGLAFLPAAGAADTAKTPAPASSAAANPAKVDLNTADIPTLESVPEIGTNFANAVVAARPFKSIDDVNRVLKLSPEKMSDLRRKVVASPVKPASPPETDTPKAAGTKPPATNDGKAMNRKDVSEPYDRTTERREAEKATPKK
jgi:hypothetical protein